jgi:peptidoglycan/LPS O-acetylase OafA/YrhL
VLTCRSMGPTNSKSAARSWKRLDGVDLLRGLAILFVLLNHVNVRLFLARVPYTKGLGAQAIDSLFYNGQAGVQIFFAVSGFLITATSLRRWGSLSNVRARDFYALRFARIAPLFLALLVVLGILHFAHLKDYVVPASRGGFWRALFAALTFHINLSEAHWGWLPGSWDVLWSLSVEEMFYLFFPLLCKLPAKIFVALLLMFVALGPVGRTVLSRGNEIWHEKSYLGSMDAIAMGCLTALLLSKVQISRRARLAGVIVGAAILILVLCCSVPLYAWGHDRFGLTYSFLALGTCMIISAAAQSQWRSPRMLSPLVNLGQRSYEVYLTHMFVVFTLFGIFVRAGKPLAAVPVLFVAVILIAGLLGELVARFYSEPMNHLLRERWGDGPERLGAAVGARDVAGANVPLPV